MYSEKSTYKNSLIMNVIGKNCIWIIWVFKNKYIEIVGSCKAIIKKENVNDCLSDLHLS